jgi:hypothetical protein
MAAEPCEGPLYDPSSLHQDEPLWRGEERHLGGPPLAPRAVAGAREDLDLHTSRFEAPSSPASVAHVGPDETDRAALVGHLGRHEVCTVAVGQSGGMYDRDDGVPLGVYEDVALSPANLLGPVVATDPPFSVVLTVWESMMAAVGSGLRPARARHISWSAR